MSDKAQEAAAIILAEEIRQRAVGADHIAYDASVPTLMVQEEDRPLLFLRWHM